MEGIEKGKYILYEELGSGGSGKVYRAFDRHLGHLSMIFDAKWQNFCVRKIPMPMLV